MTAAPSLRVVADCESYIRGHHAWLARTATTLGRAYRLEPRVHEELLAQLYEVLFRRWSQDLIGAREHARNSYAYKVLANRAEAHRYFAVDRVVHSGSEAETARSVLLDALTCQERDVIMMTHGLYKDDAQVAAELGMSLRTVSRRYESAVRKLRAGPQPLVSDEPGSVPGAPW